eukprot:1158285-Pelagomonas_calceolata.AAC.4
MKAEIKHSFLFTRLTASSCGADAVKGTYKTCCMRATFPSNPQEEGDRCDPAVSKTDHLLFFQVTPGVCDAHASQSACSSAPPESYVPPRQQSACLSGSPGVPAGSVDLRAPEAAAAAAAAVAAAAAAPASGQQAKSPQGGKRQALLAPGTAAAAGGAARPSSPCSSALGGPTLGPAGGGARRLLAAALWPPPQRPHSVGSGAGGAAAGAGVAAVTALADPAGQRGTQSLCRSGPGGRSPGGRGWRWSLPPALAAAATVAAAGTLAAAAAAAAAVASMTDASCCCQRCCRRVREQVGGRPAERGLGEACWLEGAALGQQGACWQLGPGQG